MNSSQAPNKAVEPARNTAGLFPTPLDKRKPLDKGERARYIAPSSFSKLRCKWVHPGDILICRLADPIGRACIVPDEVGDCITAVDCTIYRPDPNKLHHRYAVHLLNSDDHLKKLNDSAGGSTRQRISRSALGSCLISIPDVSVQAVIATILDSIDNTIRQTEQMIEKLQRVKVGLLHSLLTCGLDENGEFRDPIRHPEQFKASQLGMIPKDWEIEPLSKRIVLISGQHIDARDCTDNPTHVPYLTGPADFPEGFIVVSKYTPTPKVMCQIGDILITVKGSGTGKTVVADGSYCISRQLMAVRADNCDEQFLDLLLQSFAESLRADATGLIPGIAREDLLSRNICFPSFSEQQRIAEFMGRFNHQVALESYCLNKIVKLKKGLMRDLLTGSVRVDG